MQGTRLLSVTKTFSCSFLKLLAPGQAASPDPSLQPPVPRSTNHSMFIAPGRPLFPFNWLGSWHRKIEEVSTNTMCPIFIALSIIQHFAYYRIALGAFSCKLRTINIFYKLRYPVRKEQVSIYRLFHTGIYHHTESYGTRRFQFSSLLNPAARRIH